MTNSEGLDVVDPTLAVIFSQCLSSTILLLIVVFISFKYKIAIELADLSILVAMTANLYFSYLSPSIELNYQSRQVLTYMVVLALYLSGSFMSTDFLRHMLVRQLSVWAVYAMIYIKRLEADETQLEVLILAIMIIFVLECTVYSNYREKVLLFKRCKLISVQE